VIAEAKAGTALAAALQDAAARLARAGIETARLDAEVLMAEAAGVARTALAAGAARPDAGALARFEAMVARRAAREPLAYVVGHREFFSLDFEVNPAVLIPRPETETVVECALDFLSGRAEASVLDLGTGSGAIAVAIAVNAPQARVVATDISEVSLEVAQRNARSHRCADRIRFVAGDCYGALEHGWDGGPFDLIVSNPPYVAEAEADTLAPEVREFEPRAALVGGPDPLVFYRRIASGLERWLHCRGEVIVEVGAGQARAVARIFETAGCVNFAIVRDLAGVERVVRARRAGGNVEPSRAA
jgi:release factor glutamine methyltransferase